MELYHVSTINKELEILDMTKTCKTDIYFTGTLIDKVDSFAEFNNEYQLDEIKRLAKEKGWICEKIATEAVFEAIRRKSFREKPSRLVSTYYTNSMENAKKFNNAQRAGMGAIFSFEADEKNIFYFDMDIFYEACQCFRINGMQEAAFIKVKALAEKYWIGYEQHDNANCEILYQGEPILRRCDVLCPT